MPLSTSWVYMVFSCITISLKQSSSLLEIVYHGIYTSNELTKLMLSIELVTRGKGQFIPTTHVSMPNAPIMRAIPWHRDRKCMTDIKSSIPISKMYSFYNSVLNLLCLHHAFLNCYTFSSLFQDFFLKPQRLFISLT